MRGNNGKWDHLEPRASSAYKQLFIKGTRIRASLLYFAGIANGMSAEEIAEDRELPISVVEEAIKYTKLNLKQIEREEAESALKDSS